MNILLVDDNKSGLESLMDVITTVGHNPIAVETPEEALDLVEREPFDLAFVDYLMPQSSGLDLIRSLVRKCPDMWYILISGASESGLAEKAIEAGAHTFFAKPLEVETILQLLECLEYHS